MKRIFKYNFVNALQIFLAFIFQLLFARHFGASQFTDAYFVSIAILNFLLTIEASFTEMFIQYYNDVKVDDPNEAKRFYQAVFNFSLLTGIASFILSISLMGSIIKVFALGFDAGRMMVLKSFFSILVFSLIWTRLTVLNNCLINAEMRFMLPYLIGLLTPGFNIVSLLLFTEDFGINAIAVSILISGITGLVFQQVYILKTLDISLGMRLWHPKFKELIKKSLLMRFGHQVWDLKDLITTNVLSHFPPGTVSLYSYASRIISILFGITNTPVFQIFSSEVSRLVSERDFLRVRSLLKRILTINTGLCLMVLIPFAVVLPGFMGFFFAEKFSAEEIKTIHYVFLALIPFYLILSIEMPLANISIAMKQSLQIIKIDIVFIVIFGALALILIKSLGIYAIPVALIVAQTQNLIGYALNVRKVLYYSPGGVDVSESESLR